MTHPVIYLPAPTVAYFSMEVGIAADIPTYSGGLGVLAGDSLLSAADLCLPVVGVTLLHNRGYFTQRLVNGYQTEEPADWDPWSAGMEELPQRVNVKIDGQEISVKGWRYNVVGRSGHIVPLIFLDTNGNKKPWSEDITLKPLYTGDRDYRLAQEVVLGIAGVRFLQELGYDIKTYHMNESHSALLTLELLRQRKAMDKVRESCVFTTHTPVFAGHERVDYERAYKVMRDAMECAGDECVRKIAGNDQLNMTLLALNSSRYVNAVSKKHAEVTRKMFPGYEIDSITNGVHHVRWMSGPFRKLFDEEIPEWRSNPYALVKVKGIDRQKISSAQQAAGGLLVEYVEKRSEKKLDASHRRLGFARRFTAYKRPDLLLRNPDKLAEILKKHDTDLLCGGKAHPNDEPGKNLISSVNKGIEALRGKGVNAVYLEDYRMRDGRMLTSGSTVWANTPVKGEEASGTSGIKAALNGVPQLGILDGWWCEGHIEGVTGWAIGNGTSTEAEEVQDIYEKLDKVILPNSPSPEMAANVIAHSPYFTTERTMQDYARKAYGLDVKEFENVRPEKKKELVPV